MKTKAKLKSSKSSAQRRQAHGSHGAPFTCRVCGAWVPEGSVAPDAAPDLCSECIKKGAA